MALDPAEPSSSPLAPADQPPPAAAEAFSHAGLGETDAWAGWPPLRPPSAVLPVLRGLREALDVAVLALAMFLAVSLAVANYEVDGRSMEPTFHHGDRLMVNRLIYRMGDPRPGDVVVLHGNGERDLLKRVIAVGGQRIQIANGTVFVDGQAIEEPYIEERPVDYPEMVVPEGHVFVMGDNRNNSLDSRSFGPVPLDRIVGRADFRYLPFSRWGLVDHVRQEGGPDQEAAPSSSRRSEATPRAQAPVR